MRQGSGYFNKMLSKNHIDCELFINCNNYREPENSNKINMYFTEKVLRIVVFR